MWRGLPSELPVGIDNIDCIDDSHRADSAGLEDSVTSTYPAITTSYYGSRFSIPGNPVTNSPVNTRVQKQPWKRTKANAWTSYEEELQHADTELDRALLESLNTAIGQPQLNHEER